jgi:hypothetical protein
MRKRRLRKVQALLCTVLCLASLVTTAQVTTTFNAGPDWKDVTLIRGSSIDMQHPQPQSDTYYGNYDQLAATYWSNAADRGKRSLIRINIAHLIPSGTVLQSAKLVLKSLSISGGYGEKGNSGSNATYLQRVTQAWTTPTWNTQPTTTTTGQIAIPAWTSGGNGVVEVDVTAMLQDMLNNPTTNFGFMLRLQNENGPTARNFASCDYSTAASRPKLVVVTAQPIPALPERDYIFGSLDQTPISSGILTDFGFDLVDPTLYDGVIRTNNEMTIDSWRALYAEFLSATINPSSNLKSLKVINDTLDTKWRSTIQDDDRIIDVPVQFVRYQSLVANASPSMITINSNQLYDVPGRTQQPYTTKYAFAAAPTMTYDVDGKVNFRFPSSVFINSSDKTMSGFSVDFDDGLGYRSVTLNSLVNVLYPSAGTKTLRFKFTVNGGTIYYSHAKFQVYSAGTAQARYASTAGRAFKFPRASDNRCQEPTFPNPEQYQGIAAGAKVTVSYGEVGSRPDLVCNPQFIRPLIVIEGFDVSKFSAFGVDNWDFKEFVRTDRNGGIASPTSEGDDLNGKLSTEGYDLIFIDFNDGTGDIIRNAYLVENIIQWVNAHKINNPHTGLRERNVVLGQSMGGLIGRYAVCDMEKRKIANSSYASHEVRLLVTQDSPHRGANVPVGFQSLINKLAPKSLGSIGLVTYGATGLIIGSQMEIQDVVPALKQAKQLLNEPATKQMLIIQDGQTNSFLTGDYRSMITFNSGYAPTFISHAIANGSECGQPQIINSSEELFYANASLFVNPLLFTAAADILTTSATIPPVNRGLGSLTEVPFHLLVPFTGKTWKTNISVNSTNLSGSGEVFKGKLAVEKKILLLIPLNITMFDESTTVSNIGHWDSQPGGFYNLQSKRAKISGENIDAYPIVEAKLTVRVGKLFNFVPTVSALDISTTPLTSAAITSVYTNGSNTTYPSRFSNFKTQERDMGDNVLYGSRYNSRHVKFSRTSTTWLLNVLRGNNPIVTCTYSCNGGSGATMSGPVQVCASPVVYTVSNVPPGAQIFWGYSGKITLPPNSNGSSVTATPTGVDGTALVTATFVTPNCGTTATSKSLIVGNPAWPRESTNNDGSPSYVNIGPNPTVAVGEQVTIFWNDYPAKTQPITVTSQGNVSSSGPGYVAVTYPMAGTYTVAAETVGPCGWIQANQVVTVYSGFARIAGSDFGYYPNPASDNLTITLLTESENLAGNDLSSQSTKRTMTVILKDPTGNTLLSSAIDGSTIALDTSSLPNGIYYLTLIQDGREFTERIVIKH